MTHTHAQIGNINWIYQVEFYKVNEKVEKMKTWSWEWEVLKTFSRSWMGKGGEYYNILVNTLIKLSKNKKYNKHVKKLGRL